MGREHPSDTLWRAQEMYCVDRMSYAAIAEAIGVSATTLKSWGQKYEWARRKAEIAQAECEIRVNVIKGREAALKQLLNAENAKEAASMAFAVTSLESLALKRMELAAQGKLPQTAPKTARKKIVSRADAVHALREAVESKLGLALADPNYPRISNFRWHSNMAPECGIDELVIQQTPGVSLKIDKEGSFITISPKDLDGGDWRQRHCESWRRCDCGSRRHLDPESPGNRQDG